MSFIDKLGETLQDAGWFVGAPVMAAFDIAKAALPGGTPLTTGAVKAITQGFDRGTQLFFGDQTGADAGTQNLLSPGITKAGDAIDWVYREGISRPINFANIEGQRVLADTVGIEDNASPMDVGSAWDRASNTHGGYDGKGTSIGRESTNLGAGLFGAAIAPLGALGGPQFDKSIRFATLTDEGQRTLDQGKSFKDGGKSYDALSGGSDAIARFFLDPTIIGGKLLKAGRLSKAIAGVKPGEIESKLSQTSDGLFSGFGKRHEEAVKFAMAPDRSAAELIAAFPGLRESLDGESVASVLEQTNKSMRLAGRSEDEILDQGKLITRASLGDATALDNIDASVAFAKDALASMQSNKDNLKTAAEWAVKYGDSVTPEQIADKARTLNLAGDLEMRGRDYFTSDEFLKVANARIQSVSKDVRAAEQEGARQQRIQKLFGPASEPTSTFGALADRPLLASAVGASTRGLEKRAARERGENIGLDFVFQTTAWNTAVKFGAPHIYLMGKSSQAFRRMSAPPVINVEDERAGQALNTWLKHTAVDPETRIQMVSDLAANTSIVRRGQVIDDAIQRGVESKIAEFRKQNPYFTDEAEKLVRTAIAKQAIQNRTRTGAQTQMFTAAKRAEDTSTGAAGSRGDMIIDDNGMAKYHPILPTQLTKMYGMPDLKGVDHILQRHSNWITDVSEWARGNRAPDATRVQKIGEKVFGTAGKVAPRLGNAIANNDEHLNSVNDFVWKSEETAKLILDSFNHIWKAGTLATRPIAYAMRVNVDSGMRFAAAYGTSAWMMHSAPRAFGFATVGTATGAKMLLRSAQDDRRTTVLKAAMERAESSHAVTAGEKLAAGIDPDYDALKAEYDAISTRLHTYRTGGRKGRREAYGAFGEPGQKSVQTRAGEIEGAFAGEIGRRNRWLVSSETSAALLGDSNKLALKEAQLGNWTYVENTDPKHMDNWLHAVNAQLMQSDVGKEAVRLMALHADPAKASAALARWATGTTEGRKLMGELVWTAADKRAYTNEIIGYVNHYLPSHDLRVATSKNGKVSQGELETAIPNIEDRPPVHGESLAVVTNRGSVLGKMINDTAGRVMRWAGDATEDQLARHPMYAAVYEQEARRRAEFLMADPRIQKVGLDQIQKVVQEHAHKKARAAIKNYMFDVAATSDLSHFMRFTSPFIAAWEDTVRKWGRIAKENPEVIGRGMQLWNAPNAMGMVVDQDGNPVEKDGVFGYTDPKTGERKSTYILIPQGLTKWIPGAGDSQLKISKQSLNIVLQGGLQPGYGPLVAYPVAKIQTAAPQLDQVAAFVNPYGPPKSFWDAVAPTTVKALTDAVNDQSRTHEQDTRRIWSQMLAEYRLDPQKFGGKQPTIDEAAARAGALGRLKIVNRVMGVPLPGFPATFQSPYQLYIDGYHALQDRQRTENHPYGWADDEFVSQYGETFFPLVQSQSLNNGGTSATAEGVDAVTRYKSLVSKYGVEAGKANPNLIRLIVGQEGEGAYNDSAHLWQEQHEISPASGVMYRSYENPQQAQANADADLGWLKYRQKMQELDARAIQNGYRTYAEDPELVVERQQFVQSLEKDNPAWHVDWSQRDNDKFTRDLQSLGEIANSGKFGVMRTDMQGVQQYLALRQALKDELDQYQIGEGTQDAQPFRQEFTDAVSDLVSQNSQFAEWSYYTFLERDPLLEPLTSYGQPTDQPPTDWGIS